MANIIEVPQPTRFLQPAALFLRAKPDPLNFFTRAMMRGKAPRPFIVFGHVKAPTVMLFDAAAIATVMGSDFRHKGSQSDIGEDILNKGVLLSDGDEWIQQRKLMIGSFHPRAHEAMMKGVVSTIGGMIDDWKEKIRRRELICVSNAFAEMAYKVVTTALLHERSDDVGAIRSAISVLLTTGRDRFWQSPKPSAEEAFRTTPELREARDTMRQVAADMITRRRKELMVPGYDFETDLLSLLIKRFGQSNDPLAPERLLQNVITILSAGHETTGNVATGIAVSLTQNPHEWEKLVEESRRVYGNRDPKMSDYASVEVAQRIVKEGLRLHSVVPIVGRQLPPTLQNGQPVKEFFVSLDNGDQLRLTPEHRISVSPWVTHRNPKYWPDANTFNSDRHLPEVAALRPEGSFLPFTLGPRQCVAEKFAQWELATAFGMLAQHFDSLNVTKPETLKWEALGTARPEVPMHATPKIRGESPAMH